MGHLGSRCISSYIHIIDIYLIITLLIRWLVFFRQAPSSVFLFCNIFGASQEFRGGANGHKTADSERSSFNKSTKVWESEVTNASVSGCEFTIPLGFFQDGTPLCEGAGVNFRMSTFKWCYKKIRETHSGFPVGFFFKVQLSKNAIESRRRFLGSIYARSRCHHFKTGGSFWMMINPY